MLVLPVVLDLTPLFSLSLRTLEFWVDNLNPLFLYPEMSKQTELFASLMQALSHHLRPAPYPYGLLTLRLLGKLGGKNRQFLRSPLLLNRPDDARYVVRNLDIAFEWSHSSKSEDLESGGSAEVAEQGCSIALPLDRALEMLKRIALAPSPSTAKKPVDPSESESSKKEQMPWADSSRLMTSPIELVDFAYYRSNVMDVTKTQAAIASLAIVRAAVGTLGLDCATGDMELETTASDTGPDTSKQENAAALALMYASMVDVTRGEASTLLKSIATRVDPDVLASALVLFISVPGSESTAVGIRFLEDLLLQPPAGVSSDAAFDRTSFSESLIRSLCEGSTASSWDRQAGIQETICLLIDKLGSEWARGFEAMLVNASLLSVKIVPLELSNAALSALRFFIRVCIGLYGNPLGQGPTDTLVWDVLTAEAAKRGAEDETTGTPKSSTRPSEDVIRMILFEMASAQQIVR